MLSNVPLPSGETNSTLTFDLHHLASSPDLRVGGGGSIRLPWCSTAWGDCGGGQGSLLSGWPSKIYWGLSVKNLT